MTQGRRPRRIITSAAAAFLACGGARAGAQPAAPEPDPPPPETFVQEPIAEPDAPPSEPRPREPVRQTEHVPPDASEIDLTTLETKNLSLLYFDPVQTYLTPYIGRAFENALDFHQKKFK
ncbi:MAG TPA: hypothetical protein VFZ35_03045, partial [Sphingomicrobium sp.]